MEHPTLPVTIIHPSHPGMTLGQQANIVLKLLGWLFLCWLIIALIAVTKEAKDESIKNGKVIDMILKKLDAKEGP